MKTFFSWRTLHSFIVMGGSFTLIVCGIMALLNKSDLASDTLIISIIAVMPSIVALFWFPFKKMIIEEINSTYIKSIRNKVLKEKQVMGIPILFSIAVCLIALSNQSEIDNVNNPDHLYLLEICFYILAVICVLIAIALVLNYSKNTE